MKSIRAWLTAMLLCTVVTVATWASETVLEEAAREAVQSVRLVTLVIEQDGHQTLVADGGTVVLQRAPFILWVIHGTTAGILLQISNESVVYDSIGFGSAMADALGSDVGQVMGLAEGVYNSERTLYADTFAAHYLPNPRTSIDHRYNRLYFGTTESDFTVGGRDVEFIVDLTRRDKPRGFPVSNAPFDELFISAFVSTHDANYVPYILDLHRVRLEFLH
ncbi:MAG: hypothetical protein KAU31_17315 [Spirochaetaceae bacterium]|nr:hypothetical protein [Spirochaetaceae bacterium]